MQTQALRADQEREFFIDNLLVRIHFITVMIRWTSLAPWVFEFTFPGRSTFLGLNTTPQSRTKSPFFNRLNLNHTPPDSGELQYEKGDLIPL